MLDQQLRFVVEGKQQVALLLDSVRPVLWQYVLADNRAPSLATSKPTDGREQILRRCASRCLPTRRRYSKRSRRSRTGSRMVR